MKQIAIIDGSSATLYILPMPSQEWLNSKMGEHDDTDETMALEEWMEERCNASLTDSNWQVIEQSINITTKYPPLADVYNLTSPRGNKEVPNQFVITTTDGTYFKSYQSIIAFIPRGHNAFSHEPKIVLDLNKWDYSTTTGKYRNQFLGESIEETRRKIKDGVYVLANLNTH